MPSRLNVVRLSEEERSTLQAASKAEVGKMIADQIKANVNAAMAPLAEASRVTDVDPAVIQDAESALNQALNLMGVLPSGPGTNEAISRYTAAKQIVDEAAAMIRAEALPVSA